MIRGRISVPPLASAAYARAICMGVTEISAPWPIAICNTEPAIQRLTGFRSDLARRFFGGTHQFEIRASPKP